MSSSAEQLHSRTIALVRKFEQGGGSNYMDEAISLGRKALDLCPPGHSGRPVSLARLAFDLSDRYNQLGTMEDLEEAIALGREALDLRPRGHPDRTTSLNNLAADLSSRYTQLGAIQDLEEAIIFDREELGLFPQGHPARSMSLNNLAARLFSRYIRLSAIQDLDETVVLDREALDLRPQGHPDRSMSLNNLANHLASRYERLGEMQDLDEAMVLSREALDLRPHGHPLRSSSLSNLASRLSSRYDQFGSVQDLDEAIDLGGEALDLRPQGNPERTMSLNNLAVDLFSRYQRLMVVEDLDGAIVLNREALDLRPRGHPLRSSSLSNLADLLWTRYWRLGVKQDLDEVIVLGREVLDHRPQGHPGRSILLNNLAKYFFSRYDQFEIIEDLDEAIVLSREALGLRLQGHPDRSESLADLACYLGGRFMRLRQPKDEEELFSLYSQLTQVPQVVSSTDISAARAWIRVAEDFQHPTLLLAYETSLRLLVQHLATLPSLPQHHITLRHLAMSLAADAFSVCLQARAHTRAVELLEQGRCLFWSQFTRLHSPLDDVVASGPAGKNLADKFTRLALHIRDALHSPAPDQHERVCRLDLKMQKVVTNIRELPGLSRFFLSPIFSDLQHAASGGPVIIVNASKHGCDALIVLLNRDPVHIRLKVTQHDVRDWSAELHTIVAYATRVDVTKNLGSLLRKLWEQVVSPVVDSLQTILAFRSRIWWCPTAGFSVLPLHAAGPYRKGQPNLPDLYVSSYTPTLAALVRARRHDPLNSGTERKRFIAIGQAETAGSESGLYSTGLELDNVRRRVDGLATFARIDGEASRLSKIVEELGMNEWVHLACHGLPNRRQPLESAFALGDGRLTIRRLVECRRDSKDPEFAYLSACHTTVGDSESPDEAIHLAAAMQSAGFRSVIGTMWAVDDDDATNAAVAAAFYEHVVSDASGRLDHTRAAFALNGTTNSVRVAVPFDQRVLYIHVGA